jgi:hypothetical protein
MNLNKQLISYIIVIILSILKYLIVIIFIILRSCSRLLIKTKTALFFEQNKTKNKTSLSFNIIKFSYNLLLYYHYHHFKKYNKNNFSLFH